MSLPYDSSQSASRRQRRLHNPAGSAYDEGLIGGRTIDVDEDPFDGDPNVRREAYASMGHFLKADLERTRQNNDYFVEQRSTSAPHSSSDLPVRMSRPPRPVTITPTTAKYANRQEARDDYEDYEDYDEYESEDDPYNPQQNYRRATPDWIDEPEYDDIEPYEEDDEYPQPRHTTRGYRPNPASQDRYPQDSRRGRQLPDRRTPRYPGQQPGRSVRPERLSAPISQGTPQRTRQPTRQNTLRRPVPPRSVRPPEPTQPALLAQDGSIPRNPCGDFLVVRLGKMRVSIECQEERREINAPYHPGMPHIAKINDASANGNAFFVWDHDRPRTPQA